MHRHDGRAFRQVIYALSGFVNVARELVAERGGERYHRVPAQVRLYVRAAGERGLHLDYDLARAGLRDGGLTVYLKDFRLDQYCGFHGGMIAERRIVIKGKLGGGAPREFLVETIGIIHYYFFEIYDIQFDTSWKFSFLHFS